jgi:hypothetical protein
MRSTWVALRRLLLLCGGLCTAMVVHAQAASVPAPPERSSYPEARHRLQGAALVKALREGGLVIYFRHTATDFSKNDQAMLDFDDCANQRPLAEQGRADARAIGQRVAALQLAVGVVNASPMCRTMEHAKLMFGKATPNSTMREITSGEYLGLKRLLEKRVPPGINRWLVGHGIPFRAVAGPPHLAEGEAVVLRPTGDNWIVLARIAVVDWTTLGTR